MDFKLRLMSLGIALILALSFISCTRQVKEMSFSGKDAKFNILIAGNSSEFKDAVRGRIISRYEKYSNILVINIPKLKEMDSESYDVVLIMDDCLAWSELNSHMKAYLDEPSNRKKVVLLMTAGDPDWKFCYKGVDAVTSASAPCNETLVFDRLTRKIDEILAGR